MFTVKFAGGHSIVDAGHIHMFLVGMRSCGVIMSNCSIASATRTREAKKLAEKWGMNYEERDSDRNNG